MNRTVCDRLNDIDTKIFTALELATRLGISQDHARVALNKAGLPYRRIRTTGEGLFTEKVKTFCENNDISTMSLAKIAGEVGCSIATISKDFERLGISKRDNRYAPGISPLMRQDLIRRLGYESNATLAAEYGLSMTTVRELSVKNTSVVSIPNVTDILEIIEPNEAKRKLYLGMILNGS